MSRLFSNPPFVLRFQTNILDTRLAKTFRVEYVSANLLLPPGLIYTLQLKELVVALLYINTYHVYRAIFEVNTNQSQFTWNRTARTADASGVH